jgi:hypothetical protein
MDFLELILTASTTGLGTGLGVAIGTYFSNKLIIKHLDKLETLLKKKKSKPKLSIDNL